MNATTDKADAPHQTGDAPATVEVGVAYAGTTQQRWLQTEVPAGATVHEAIERSGILELFPEIDLDRQKVGVFAKLTRLDAPVRQGDRVEIYRPIIADPKTVRRRPAAEETEGGGGD